MREAAGTTRPGLAAPFAGWERRAQRAFRAMLLALSYPGQPFPLGAGNPREGLMRLAEALADEEVGVHAPPWLLEGLLPLRPRPAPPEEAELVFLESAEEVLRLLPCLHRGTPLAPETGATLFLPANLDRGPAVGVQGPGVPGEVRFRADLPPAFWEARAGLLAYPLGVEVFLTDGRAVIGLPRTAEVRPWGT